MLNWKYGYAKNDQLKKELEKDYDKRIEEHNFLSQVDDEFADDYYDKYPFIRKQAIKFAEDELHAMADSLMLSRGKNND